MGYIFDALNRIKNPANPGPGATPDPDPTKGQTAPAQGDRPPHDQHKTPRSTMPFTQQGTPPFQPLKFGDHASVMENGSLITDERLVAFNEPASVMAEEYRSIRTGILARWQQKRHLVHMITSATPQEGKTITSLNLGFSFAELKNRRTVVVEADLRLPQFDKMITLPRSPGLVGLLESKATLSQAVHRLANDRLHVITAGRRLDSMHAAQLLAGSSMSTLIKTLRSSYDHVIIDTPPVVELADAGILGATCDEVLLIARMNRTPQALVEQAIRTLGSYNASVGGLIATDQNRPQRRFYYKYGYKYSYGYHDNAYSAKQAA